MNRGERLRTIKERILREKLTMLPPRVLENFRLCIEDVEMGHVAGDVVEAGVWRGGACIYAYHVLGALGSARKLWVCDSFEGLPPPNALEYPADAGDPHHLMPIFRVGLEQVKANFRLFGPIDESVVFVKGWFSDTMPGLGVEAISVLRLDGDMYESTFLVLENLYPKLSVGGYCIIDDWGHKRAHQAVVDYRSREGITDEIIIIDPTPKAYPSAYWKKER